jgi:protein-tyrosine phosphatase
MTERNSYLRAATPGELDIAWIEPGFAIGSKPYIGQRERIRQLGVMHVLSLVEVAAEERDHWGRLGVAVRSIPVVDWALIPPRRLEQVVVAALEVLSARETLLLHCLAGVNRAPTAAAAVLCRRDGLDVDAALARVLTARPSASPTPEQVISLRQWLRSGSGELRL